MTFNHPVKLFLTQWCEISHFVRNDNHVVIVGVGLVCGKAANQPHSPQPSQTLVILNVVKNLRLLTGHQNLQISKSPHL